MGLKSTVSFLVLNGLFQPLCVWTYTGIHGNCSFLLSIVDIWVWFCSSTQRNTQEFFLWWMTAWLLSSQPFSLCLWLCACVWGWVWTALYCWKHSRLCTDCIQTQTETVLFGETAGGKECGSFAYVRALYSDHHPSNMIQEWSGTHRLNILVMPRGRYVVYFIHCIVCLCISE